MKQRQNATPATKKEEFYPRVQSQPKLGGEGSGFPPRFYIALGQHNHTMLGIDLGSESIRVAVLEEDDLKSIVQGAPTCLGLGSQGNWVLTNAEPTYANNYMAMVKSLRTKLGTNWSRDLAGQTVECEELLGHLMRYAFAISQAKYPKSLRDAVFTVPASYSSLERKLLLSAAELQGLNVIRLINEPTAAALAYYAANQDMKDGHYMIFHLGASTCATTVFSLSNRIMEIKATSADNHLGGRTFDEILIEYLINEFVLEYGVWPRLDDAALNRYEQLAISIKKDLLYSQEAFYSIAGLSEKDPAHALRKITKPDQKTGFTSITRQHYEYLISPLVEKAVSHIDKALQQARLSSADIRLLLVCGGGTLSPALMNAIREANAADAIKRLEDDMYPAYGAALQACLVSHKTDSLVVWDVLNKPIGIIDPTGKETPLIARDTPLPFTAYAKLEIVDNTINAKLVQGSIEEARTITDIVINNCPPCSNGENRVELAVRVNQDGIITYGARHIGLDVALLVTPLQEERRRYQGDIDRHLNAGKVDSAGSRAKRLARILNTPLYFLPQALRAMGYSPEEIAGGQAVELALRKIKMERRKKRNGE